MTKHIMTVDPILGIVYSRCWIKTQKSCKIKSTVEKKKSTAEFIRNSKSNQTIILLAERMCIKKNQNCYTFKDNSILIF